MSVPLDLADLSARDAQVDWDHHCEIRYVLADLVESTPGLSLARPAPDARATSWVAVVGLLVSLGLWCGIGLGLLSGASGSLLFSLALVSFALLMFVGPGVMRAAPAAPAADAPAWNGPPAITYSVHSELADDGSVRALLERTAFGQADVVAALQLPATASAVDIAEAVGDLTRQASQLTEAAAEQRDRAVEAARERWSDYGLTREERCAEHAELRAANSDIVEHLNRS